MHMVEIKLFDNARIFFFVSRPSGVELDIVLLE